MSMKTMMRIMTIPGLNGTRQLENCRMESMRNAVPADEKPSRDVNDRPGESGEGQGEIMSPNGEELARALSVLVQSGVSEPYSGMLSMVRASVR